MKIFYNTVGKSYEDEVCENFISRGHEVAKFTSDMTHEILADFENTTGLTCLMIHISNDNGVSKATKLLTSKKMDNKSIVLISTFQTWGGRRYNHSISDIESTFFGRVASHSCSVPYYSLENSFYTKSKLCKRGCIIGVGLVYGKGGFDFQRTFT